MSKNIVSKIWRILNAALSLFFMFLIVNSWAQILFFDSKEKSDYYIATLFIIPLFTCLIVVFGWELEK
jgi:hypothetical protein